MMNTIIDALQRRFIPRIRRWPISGWAKTGLIGLVVVIWFAGAFLLSVLVLQLLWGWIVPDLAPGTLVPALSFGSACKVVLALALLQLGRLVQRVKATGDDVA